MNQDNPRKEMTQTNGWFKVTKALQRQLFRMMKNLQLQISGKVTVSTFSSFQRTLNLSK